MKKSNVSTKTKANKIIQGEIIPKTESKKSDKKRYNKQVNKDINIQNDKSVSIKDDKVLNKSGKQSYLFSTQETDMGGFQLESLNQKKAKKAKDIDLKEAWYCPSKELHAAFRFYAFQNNMKKSNILTKAIVEMLEREGFLKKT